MAKSVAKFESVGLVLGLAIVMLSVALAIVASNSTLPPSPSSVVVAAQLIAGLTFVGVGSVLWRRHRAVRIGLLCQLVAFALAAPNARWIPSDLTWTVGWVLVDTHLVALAWLILAFPVGRLKKAERIFISMSAAYFVASKLAGHLFQDPSPGCAECPSNLLLIRDDATLNNLIWDLAQLGNLVILGVFVALVVNRRREATSAARKAHLPVMWALAPICLTLVAVFIEPIVGFGSVGGGIVLVAERIALTAFPLALLAGMVAARFDHARVADLARAANRVSEPGELESLVRDVLNDPTAVIALTGSDSDGLIDLSGEPMVTAPGAELAPISWETGEVVGTIVHDPAVEPSLVEAVAATVSMAVHNERLRSELRQQLQEVTISRQRLAEATVAERHRLERDLHDGAQQGLLALGASLSSIRLAAEPRLATRLDTAICDLQTLIEELRELARGVHPPLLSDRGLMPAIAALAERSTLPVTVDGRAPRCRPAIEAAIYFLVAESLTNTTRHAQASQVTIEVAERDDHLRVVVIDDGVGGANARPGSGLQGLADRLAALGGAMRVISPPGQGTRIEGEVPCG